MYLRHMRQGHLTNILDTLHATSICLCTGRYLRLPYPTKLKWGYFCCVCYKVKLFVIPIMVCQTSKSNCCMKTPFSARTSWFGSTVPLNRTEVLGSIHTKTQEEYDTIKRTEQSARLARSGGWPEYSEYTDKFLLGGLDTTLPPISRFTHVSIPE